MKILFTYIIGILFTLTAGKALAAPPATRYGDDGKKPKYIWIDADNCLRFVTTDSVRYYLDKAKATGFNHIVVDVKPVSCYALFPSKTVAPLTEMKGRPFKIDHDYLQTFIDEAHKRNMGVSVSTTIFPAGSTIFKKGPAYDGPSMKGRTCIEYTPHGMMDIKDDTTQVAAFLNPSLPANQRYVLKFVRELLKKYDFEGYTLDYCRYPGAMSDFSEYTHHAFERYIGSKVEKWPQDIFTYDAQGNQVPGKYYRQWWEYRAKMIHDMVAAIGHEAKRIRPNIEFQYWAASWIYAIHGNGQNWASDRFDMSTVKGNDWASKQYGHYGFAGQLDAFMLGAYLERIYGMNDLESIEYAIARAKKIIDGDCKIYNSIYARNHGDQTADAVYVSLRDSQGLVVFDLIHVIRQNLWEQIRQGITRAENENDTK